MLGELARGSREYGKIGLDQHDALATSHIRWRMRSKRRSSVRVRVALTVLGVDFPHDLDEAPQTSPR